MEVTLTETVLGSKARKLLVEKGKKMAAPQGQKLMHDVAAL